MTTKRRQPRRGWGQLRKLPSGRYQAKYTGSDLLVHPAPQTFETKMDAEGWLSTVRRSIDLGTGCVAAPTARHRHPPCAARPRWYGRGARPTADRQGWTLQLHTDAGISGATMTNRPALADAMDALDRGEADILLASKLDRVSRSVRDFAELLDRARRHGWRVVLLDLGDTSSASGEMTANIIASAAQYERRLIGQRTREGLAAKRAQGVRLGRPSVLPSETVARIVRERAEGKGLRIIAEGLTAEGIRTARGGLTWSTSSVQAVLAGQDAAALTTTA